MAKLVVAMNLSLDGYVDHEGFAPPGPLLFRHFVKLLGNLSGSLYGRGLYEVMRYWDEDDPNWNADQRDFAMVWRRQPKWVVSRTLQSVGPNATLISGDVEAAVRRLKAERDGDIEVGGPELAASLAGLIDEYRLYFRPFVLGQGKPFFVGPRPPLRLAAQECIGEDAVKADV